MARLSYVRSDVKTKTVRLAFASDDGEDMIYTVGQSFYQSIGSPVKGELLDEYTISEIEKEDDYRRATRKALALLELHDNNERTLVTKLVMKGFDRELSKEVAREMVSLGYINELRQLERLVELDANVKLFGKERIMRHLASRGYSISDVRKMILSLVDEGVIDFQKNAEKLLEKKLYGEYSEEEKNKILYKYGYKFQLK